ncbi:hypothetical protein [Teredinibacter sp. KSP-S5-2]|uniref:hypothetical protein n=1 Tax=Teredinibacter sp. KSP-S5-2 TaxID=3034506 RepID=UPI0029342755|nr:hypothetical protein [Teredinibacter sp. KSP-S5-2]WNO10742.1 hypothetical protein P5V12_06090 [Teredinibacter sp. KSP-S5-2]
MMGSAGFDYVNDRAWQQVAGRTIYAAVIGGTVSKMTGGKFANGAVTAAMAHALNAEYTGAKTAASQE